MAYLLFFNVTICACVKKFVTVFSVKHLWRYFAILLFLLLLSCSTFLVNDKISGFLYLSHKRRDVQVVACFFGLSSHLRKEQVFILKNNLINGHRSSCNVCYFYPVLTEMGMSGQISVKIPNMK
jgi:hypothetical protein